MGRRIEVDYPMVEAAILAVLADGDNATFPKVYVKLGRKGGGERVQQLMAEWRKRCVDRFAAPELQVPEVADPHLVEVVRDGVLAAQRVARSIAAAEYANQQAALEDERRRLKEEMDATRTLEAASEARRRQLENELSLARTESVEREARIADLQAALQRQQADLDAERVRMKDLDQDRERLQRALAQAVQDAAAAVTLESALKDATRRLESAETKLEAAQHDLTEVRVRYDTAEEHRQEVTRRSTAQAEELGALRTRLQHVEQELSQARGRPMN